MYDEDANKEDENAESSDYNRSWFHTRKDLNEQDLKNLHPHIRSKYLAVWYIHTYCQFISQVVFGLLAYYHITFTIPNSQIHNMHITSLFIN